MSATRERAGSNAGWIRSLLERHEGPLIRYAARITGDVERARDVVQDTFLRLCEKKPSDIPEHPTEWLFTVCRNRALDVRRKESRMRNAAELTADTCESREPSPAEAVERKEAAGEALRSLETLPENQQEVLRLKFQDGLSYKEISSITDLTVTHVGFLIHTGLKNLRQKLKVRSGLAPRA